MKAWRDIKVEAISLNVHRNEVGMTVEQMLEKVRALIAENGYQTSGPVRTSEGYEFRAVDGKSLTYLEARNTWE